jgi:PAS domain S-box-containing protein
MAAHPMLKSDDPGLSLALAMVCSSPSPLVMLDGESRVIAISASFCDVFQIDPGQAVGQSFFALGAGEWDAPQLRSLMAATASGDAQIDAYEFDLNRRSGASRHLVVNARKLAYGNSGTIRLLVGVDDVSAVRALARRNSDLTRDHDLLAQEVRHRVANSLQIIASVMMMNARRTSSEETRGHLRDAHNRVMSVADLQQQLAVTTVGEVSIGAYLTRLCETITASMIGEPKALSIVVTAPDTPVDADVSVSLGLIVTELVINALKHGFPDGAGGRIDVEYAAAGPLWTLSVADTGAGMPEEAKKASGGLRRGGRAEPRHQSLDRARRRRAAQFRYGPSPAAGRRLASGLRPLNSPIATPVSLTGRLPDNASGHCGGMR